MTKTELLAEQARLLALANEMARRHWGVDYTGTLRLTRRYWRRMDAAFAFNTETGLQEIRMSAPVNAENGAEETESNLLHELVHWRLFTLKLPFDDVNDEFIAECLRVGAPLSGGTREKAAYERYLKRNGEAA